MRIEHVAIWVRDLEKETAFFRDYLQGVPSGGVYHNPERGFTSRFMTFDGGPRLELMSLETLAAHGPEAPRPGWAHVAFSLSDRQKVDSLTERILRDGYEVVSGPRWTGDGYYESVVRDPEGNLVELTE